MGLSNLFKAFGDNDAIPTVKASQKWLEVYEISGFQDRAETIFFSHLDYYISKNSKQEKRLL